ncbi:ABC transporter substrate-binding protein [Streptomyces europaeiscabiei]|uniref:Sugar ABC transporter substrate-binding protein n=2 Tax=Streptomyces europaeiscabiei TaxID=146819 RepID=A0ABU4NN02_9ACTN|nr:sugar ABC transporter substrate-binding protein [Streptomyces europaeiscabiei]MDX2767190.1 sugar ABC transporter substrate-binding protein [Streptomyces europaeiscabiei]MDX3546619.1 sugar ABC transporter substrate-binding protein [Streptomyces europaeiscabiei]MDX3556313.1 sugar ABC transporter substrate-binding protein [Streptomyces europaeiscabiei]MDX3704198.1 sugar ABC transporter substrate-binding protein [Streptomyces europaeiscabiei]MDX3714836.1 sugar ABC transporter substrate-binding 
MGVRRRSRRLAAMITVAGLAFGAAACGSGSDSAGGGDPNTLEVWTRSNPDPAATYERVFAAFTEKTGIRIDYQPVINFDQQLQSRASTRDLPDVMINDTALMGSYQSQGLLKPIDPAAIEGHDQITDRTWASTVGIDGEHYGIPYSRQAQTLMIRKDWLKKLGLQAPTTWAEMLGVAKAFADRDPDGDGRKDTYGMVVPGSAQNGYAAWWGASFLWSGGAKIIEPDGKGYRPAMDSAAAVRTVTWMKDNLFCGDNGVIQPGAISAVTGTATNFQDGNAGMYLTGPYNIATYDATPGKDKYAVVPFPAGPAGSTVLADGENVYFGARTGKTKQEQALAAFLISPEGQKLAMTGKNQPVVRIPVNATLDAAQVRDDPRWSVVQKAYEDASEQFPNAPDFAPIKQDTADALNAVFTYCGSDVGTGLKELNDTLAGDLKDQDLLK